MFVLIFLYESPSDPDSDDDNLLTDRHESQQNVFLWSLDKASNYQERDKEVLDDSFNSANCSSALLHPKIYGAEQRERGREREKETRKSVGVVELVSNQLSIHGRQ